MKKGQIWIETVVYTLIGLTIISSMLYVALPKINQMTDKAVVNQAIDSMNVIDTEIGNLLISAGNKREIFLNVKKGEYLIDCSADKINFMLKGTNLKYSEANETIIDGEITKVTQARGDKFDIFLTLNYNYVNFTFENKEINKTLTSSPNAYRLLFENLGSGSGNSTQVNLKII